MGDPSRVSRKGKARPLEPGRGKHSPPANLERVTAGALERKGNGGSPHEIEISLLFRRLRVFIMSDPVNSGKGERLAQILGLSVSSLRPSGPFLGLKYPFAVVLQLSYGFLYIV